MLSNLISCRSDNLLSLILPFFLQVTVIYNKALATKNTEIIVNSVIILFVMEIDEAIFSAVVAINEKWAKHAAESEELASTSESSGSGGRAQAQAQALKDNEVVEMKDEIALQRTQITTQREQIETQTAEIEILKAQIATQKVELAEQKKQTDLLSEAVQKIQALPSMTSASDSESLTE